MVRHLMAVCVFCLLCVDHLPCKLHLENEISDNEKAVVTRRIFSENKNEGIVSKLPSTTNIPLSVNTELIEIIQNENVDGNVNIVRTSSPKIPLKRHASYDFHGNNNFHQEFRPILTKAYLDKIFEEYGQNDKHTLDHFEFQLLLKRLGLLQFLQDQQTVLEEVAAENQTV